MAGTHGKVSCITWVNKFQVLRYAGALFIIQNCLFVSRKTSAPESFPAAGYQWKKKKKHLLNVFLSLKKSMT